MKTQLFSILLLAIVSVGAKAQNTWATKITPGAGQSITDYGITSDMAWYTVKSGTFRSVFKSNDKGNSWYLGLLPGQPNGFARATHVHFWNQQKAVFGYPTTQGHYELYSSQDSGLTMTLLSDTLFAAYSNKPISSNITWISESVGFGKRSTALSHTTSGQPEIMMFLTIDGGQTWKLPSDNLISQGIETINIRSYQFVDANNGYAWVKQTLYKTTNGGDNWVATTVTGDGEAYFFDANHGIIIKNTTIGSVQLDTAMVTADGATTLTASVLSKNKLWKANKYGPSDTREIHEIESVSWLDKDNVIVSASYNNDLFILLKSNDGGATFSQDVVDPNTPAYQNVIYIPDVMYVSSTAAFAKFGNQVIGYGDLKADVSTNLGAGIAEDVESNKLKIYPNPAQGYFSIQDFIGQLEIYDSAGRQVLKTSVIYDKEFSLLNWESGVYHVSGQSKSGRTSSLLIVN